MALNGVFQVAVDRKAGKQVAGRGPLLEEIYAVVACRPQTLEKRRPLKQTDPNSQDAPNPGPCAGPAAQRVPGRNVEPVRDLVATVVVGGKHTDSISQSPRPRRRELE